MSNHLIEVLCPCCNKRIEVDTRNGKARALRTDDSGLDDLVAEQKGRSSALADMFDSAISDQKQDSSRLDQLFEQAKDDAKDDDSTPSNPFDNE